MSIRKHRQEARLRTHAKAAAVGKTAGPRASWLARKTARVKRRAEKAAADDHREPESEEPQP
jgi:hypothetical protein